MQAKKGIHHVNRVNIYIIREPTEIFQIEIHATNVCNAEKTDLWSAANSE